ncbi:MAG: hypothetical protein ACM3UZ_00540 [Acidobacteriota bacterium]
MSKKAILGLVLGLSLIGLLLVGLFLSASMSIYKSTQTQAINNACRSNLKVIDGAVQMYLADKKKDPNMSDLINEKYLAEIPQCPAGAHYFLQGRANARHAVCPQSHKYRIE